MENVIALSIGRCIFEVELIKYHKADMKHFKVHIKPT